MNEGKELDSLSRHLYLFEYKGVKITGFVRDEVELLRGHLKNQIDLRIYNERAKEILLSYIPVYDSLLPRSDYELNNTIKKKLEEIEIDWGRD